LLFALAYAALAVMPGTLWVYLAIVLFIGVGAGPATAPLVVTRPVVSAFHRSRGMALALGMSGAAMICTLLLPSLQSVISHYGWRAGYAFMAPVSVVLGAGAYLLLGAGARRVTPEHPVHLSDGLSGHSVKEAMGDSRFWLLGLSMVCISMASGAFGAQLQPLLSDLKVPGQTAALLGAGYAASVVLGRLTAGFLLDRLWPPLVGAIALSGPAIGLPLFIAPHPSLGLLIAGVGLVGVSTGAEGDMLAFFTARYFGLKAFGAVFGVLGMLFALSVAAGGMGAGFMFDKAGSYAPTLTIGALLALASAISLLASGLVRGRGHRTQAPVILDLAVLETPIAGA
jgi:MFS family permease